MTDWRLRAACVGVDPELFFPDGNGDPRRKQAQAICDDCPVRRECLKFAEREDIPYGVFGGRTARERGISSFKRVEPDKSHRTFRMVQPHGTPAAWRRHKRNDEPPCEPCRLAYNAEYAYIKKLRREASQ